MSGRAAYTPLAVEGEGVAPVPVTSKRWPCYSRKAQLAAILTLVAGLAALALVGTHVVGRSWRQALSTAGGSEASAAFELTDEPSSNCSSPKPHSSCARDIDYAMAHIKKHPDWYVGLHESSDPKEYQLFLHRQVTSDGPRCPRPCGKIRKQEHIWGECHDSLGGEKCHNHVMYTMKENLPKHPEWYPGLEQNSPFSVVQAYLHKQGVCPKPCHVAKVVKKHNHTKMGTTKSGEPCHTAEAGEACYGDVVFAMEQLQKDETGKTSKKWYNGKLNDASSAHEVQAYLHNQKSEDTSQQCPMPCDEGPDVGHAVKQVKCRRILEGTPCWKAVVWVVKTGIYERPKWYAGSNISHTSTFEHVQNWLAKKKDKHCTKPACSCETAQKGDSCWGAISWVKTVGLKNHSSWYKGLDKHSTNDEIQHRLHFDKHSKCQAPCAYPPWWEKPGKKGGAATI